jgi:hypothetical protein
VVVHNLNFVGVSLAPHKANAPFVIAANAVLPLTVAFQFLQPVQPEVFSRAPNPCKQLEVGEFLGSGVVVGMDLNH